MTFIMEVNVVDNSMSWFAQETVFFYTVIIFFTFIIYLWEVLVGVNQ